MRMTENKKLEFDTGSLSKEEIEAVLETLPADLTFVDSKDNVGYFNRLGRRIFPRTPAVIGRNVRQCHPEKSLTKVEQILSEFRSGKRDSAEFWINLKGRMIYIRYFAVRDKKSKYIGCLEVSQDITEIQKLKGEKRLL
ncbi:MAG: PAS domain-containing protein [Candidatus Aenigmatarchaeota archaeon]